MFHVQEIQERAIAAILRDLRKFSGVAGGFGDLIIPSPACRAGTLVATVRCL